MGFPVVFKNLPISIAALRRAALSLVSATSLEYIAPMNQVYDFVSFLGKQKEWEDDWANIGYDNEIMKKEFPLVISAIEEIMENNSIDELKTFNFEVAKNSEKNREFLYIDFNQQIAISYWMIMHRENLQDEYEKRILSIRNKKNDIYIYGYTLGDGDQLIYDKKHNYSKNELLYTNWKIQYNSYKRDIEKYWEKDKSLQIVKIDLKDAFPNLRRKKTNKIYADYLIELEDKLHENDKGVKYGFSIHAYYIANFFIANFIDRLASFKNINAIFVYVDDMYIFCENAKLLKGELDSNKFTLEEDGFVVNGEKLMVFQSNDALDFEAIHGYNLESFINDGQIKFLPKKVGTEVVPKNFSEKNKLIDINEQIKQLNSENFSSIFNEIIYLKYAKILLEKIIIESIKKGTFFAIMQMIKSEFDKSSPPIKRLIYSKINKINLHDQKHFDKFLINYTLYFEERLSKIHEGDKRIFQLKHQLRKFSNTQSLFREMDFNQKMSDFKNILNEVFKKLKVDMEQSDE